MYHYVMLAWSAESAAADAAARQMSEVLLASSQGWSRTFSAHGAVLLTKRAGESPRNCYFLAAGAGVVFGQLFSSPGCNPVPRILDPATSSAIVDSHGTQLTRRYWGAYVALIRGLTPQQHLIIRDCSGKVPCYYMAAGEVTVAFADIADLAPLRFASFTIDTQYLAAFISWTQLQIRRTALREVTEVLAGDCVEVRGNARNQHSIWDPREVCATRLVNSHSEARSLLRETTQACIDSWVQVFPNVLHALSGGLDSAIVLGCLKRAPALRQVTCVNFYSATVGDDERRFARRAAAFNDVILKEQERTYDERLFDARLLLEPKTSKPTLTALFDIDERAFSERIARPIGAASMWTGEGGDHLFLAMKSICGAVDHVANRGFCLETLSEISNAARLSGIPFWSVLKAVSSSARRRRVSELDQLFRPDLAFLSPQALPTSPVDFLASPWMTSARELPAGKREQIFYLADILNRKRPVAGLEFGAQHHPLLSQPLIELCLQIPTYVLSAGGRERGLARAAFGDLLPGEIANRFDKGETSSYLMDVIRGSSAFIAELLADGFLAQSGILRPDALRPYLKRERMFRDEHVGPFLACFAAEVWARTWTSSSRRLAA